MENRNEPMKYSEWVRQEHFTLYGNIDELMEAYTQYRLSFQPAARLIDNSVAFAEWLPRNAQPKSIDRNWILNADKKEYTTTELYQLFLNPKGNKAIVNDAEQLYPKCPWCGKHLPEKHYCIDYL